MRRGSLDFQGKKAHAITLWDLSIILWKVVCSEMLEHHLDAMQNTGLLRIPIFSNKARYEAYTNGSEAGQGEDEGEGGGVGEGEGEGEGGEEDDMEAVRLQAEVDASLDQLHAGKASAYRRWMRLLVNHLISLDTLRKYCKNEENHSVDICLLAVEQPNPSPTVADWPSVLRGLRSRPGGCSISADNIEKAITILQNHIGDTGKNPSTSKSPSTSGKNPSTNTFRWILSKTRSKGKNSSGDQSPSSDQSLSRDQSPSRGKKALPRPAVVEAFHSGFPCRVHCEAALTSMMKYPERLTGESTYLKSLAVCPQLCH